MADGLCMGVWIGDGIDKNNVNGGGASHPCENGQSAKCALSKCNDDFYVESAGCKLFDKLCHRRDGPIDNAAQQGLTFNSSSNSSSSNSSGFELDDCRKKRCVDRYDSSESSDSGVAVLSCTDCSGSSTASSDITDPGSPFSTTSSTHSEDSGTVQQSQPQKMPPTQTSSHHPLWPWPSATAIANEENAQITTTTTTKRSILETTKTATTNNNHCTKRIKSNEDVFKSSDLITTATTPNPSLNNAKKTLTSQVSKAKTMIDTHHQQKQGKITEYFKTQMKLHVIGTNQKDQKGKLVDQQTQFNGIRPNSGRNVNRKDERITMKNRKVTVPRKILPAPSKMPDHINHHNHLGSLAANFTPTVTLTALSFPSNLAYLHTKTPKPPDTSPPIFVPQFATIPNKINAIPTQCLNVIQPMQNFNCVKLNATVVPIVKLNALPTTASANASNNRMNVSVETAVPTVLSAKPKIQDTTNSSRIIDVQDVKTPPSAGDSDSGISIRGALEVSITADTVTTPSQKSPILSQPKTIRFPATKRETKEDGKESGKTSPTQDRGMCRWEECSAQFDTSGALLEHLQVKHVISQASQEHYVCLWLGCKVHGRTSCSRSWLERHVLAHAGTKPFRCIVDGCGQRFNSQLTLERHVNNHFTGDNSQANSAKKSTENPSCKLFKRNGKKIRFRRQPWSARMFDFMDSGIMEGLQHKLLTMTEERTMDQIHNAGNTVNVLSEVIAKRVEPSGRAQLLIRWHPSDIIPDEWVPEKEYVARKSVPIPSLSACSKDVLSSRLFSRQTSSSSSSNNINKRKRRKPMITNQQQT